MVRLLLEFYTGISIYIGGEKRRDRGTRHIYNYEHANHSKNDTILG